MQFTGKVHEPHEIQFSCISFWIVNIVPGIREVTVVPVAHAVYW